MHPIPIGGGSTLGESLQWRLREADADDVTAGDAVEVGDLLVENKVTGIKHAFEVTE